MSPDADKQRQEPGESSCSRIGDSNGNDIQGSEDDSLECVVLPQSRVKTDFSVVEQPVRCYLMNQGRKLVCNGRTAVFMTSSINNAASNLDQFALLPQEDGTIVMRNFKSQRCISSNPDTGCVYASVSARDEESQKWIFEESSDGSGFLIRSALGKCALECSGNSVTAVDSSITQTPSSSSTIWNVQFCSGELCFLSLSCVDKRLRCDLLGNLSLSSNYQGWEAFRISDAGNGHIRISPWAHSALYLSSDDDGRLVATEISHGSPEVWSVEKVSSCGREGVVIQSATTGRILGYNKTDELLLTVPKGEMDDTTLWDFESIHRDIYHFVCSENFKKLEASKQGLRTRNFPGRLSSEEWVVKSYDEARAPGVVTIFSTVRQQYLVSNEIGEVSLSDEELLSGKGEHQWSIEEQGDGQCAILSYLVDRVLVIPDEEPLCTVPRGTLVKGGTRWNMEPKLPRQVNKEKMQAVGAAVAVGVATTVATPFVIGGAIGIIGVTQIGAAGQIAIGTFRAAEAITSISRLTVSSSQLILTSSHRSESSVTEKAKISLLSKSSKRFSCWRTW